MRWSPLPFMHGIITPCVGEMHDKNRAEKEPAGKRGDGSDFARGMAIRIWRHRP